MGPRAFLRFAEAGGFMGRGPSCEFGPRAVCRCAEAGGFRGREPFYVMRWPAAFISTCFS